MKLRTLSLVFPPQFEPFQPYLASAVLQAHCRKRGIPTAFYDLNLAYYSWTLGEPSPLRSVERETTLSFDNYRATISTMTAALRSHQFESEQLGFYGFGFGDRLYSAEGLLDLVNESSWSRSFTKFLEEFFRTTGEIADTVLLAVTLVIHEQLPAAMLLSQFVRHHLPGCLICWGGPLISRIGVAVAKESSLQSYFDLLIRGAGESALPQIWETAAEGLSKGGNRFSNVPGAVGTPVASFSNSHPARPLPEFLMPDFSNFPLDDYLSPNLVLPYLTSRGCYWGKCEFCCHYLPFAKYETERASRVVTHLEELSNKHRTEYFSFSDEAIPVVLLRRLSEEIIARDLRLRWFTFARMEKGFTEETCKLLYRAGCRILMFGFETAVQRVADLMQKGTSVGDAVSILTACKKAGISVRLDILIGFPTETFDESELTLEFLLSNRDLIDTAFSVTPLSKFELLGDAPMIARLEKFGVVDQGPLRGHLDYQRSYSTESGMGPGEVEQQYSRYVSILSREFSAHSRMPENKTHAFLLKCSYSDQRREEELFADEIAANCLEDYRFEVQGAFHLELEIHGRAIVECSNGAKFEVGSALAPILLTVQRYGCIHPLYLTDSNRLKLSKFLTYLTRQGILRAMLKSDALQRV